MLVLNVFFNSGNAIVDKTIVFVASVNSGSECVEKACVFIALLNSGSEMIEQPFVQIVCSIMERQLLKK